MELQTGNAELMTCFYVPQAAETFIKGLFMHQQLQIADAQTKTTFQVTQVESMPELTINADRYPYLLQPLSPLVVGRKNSRGHYDYRSPEDEDFSECLLYNWIEKYGAVYDADAEALHQLREKVHVAVRLFPHPPQQRLVTIKGGTDAETRIRGYMKFQLAVTAPAALMELALGAGLGLHNAQGFGCVGGV